MATYTQSRTVNAVQITFQAADKAKAAAGKVVYVDGRHLQYNKIENVYYITRPINSHMRKVPENYWIVTDPATGQETLWSPTDFSSQHV